MQEPNNQNEKGSAVDELEFLSEAGIGSPGSGGRGKKWSIRVDSFRHRNKELATSSNGNNNNNKRSGVKGPTLNKKGVEYGKQEKKKQDKGEGGALMCFQVIKTNQYGKRQNRYIF